MRRAFDLIVALRREQGRRVVTAISIVAEEPVDLFRRQGGALRRMPVEIDAVRERVREAIAT